MQVLTMHDGSAHPATSASLKKVSQLGEFFRHSLDDWLKAISRKGFISLQVDTASLLLFSTVQMGNDASNHK